MFGYVTINQGELRQEEADRYRAYYCGLCRSLYRSAGRLGQATLTYDMTFLVILLTSLYEEEPEFLSSRCIVHPAKKRDKLCGVFSDYAADMNILLSYHNLLDDWRDDQKYLRKAAATLLSGKVRQIAARYPRQDQAVRTYMQELLKVEKKDEADIEKAAFLTGQLLSEIFEFRQDVWEQTLRQMGMYLGKFIYYMDAFEDVDEDICRGSYNPFKLLRSREDFPDLCKSIMLMQMSECCRAFERLPLELDVGILRNILYSGVWAKFAGVYNKFLEKGENV